MIKELTGKARRLLLSIVRPRFLSVSRRPIKLVELGSPHGAKVIADLPSAYGSFLVSGGAGEDISFDLEFLRLFGGRVVLVDPTDRAENHFMSTVERVGNPAVVGYSSTGSQPVEAYSLVGIEVGDLLFKKRALWSSDNQEIELFPPPNPEHVSFSITGIQGKSKSHAETLITRTITVDRLLEHFEVSGANYILKLDVEGAAREVLRQVVALRRLPTQIILEFDEMFFPSLQNYRVVWLTRFLLWRAGFRAVCARGFDVTYVRKVLL